MRFSRLLSDVEQDCQNWQDCQDCQEWKQKFSDAPNEKLQKVLAFLFSSCYKMTSSPHWRTSFWATCNPALLRLAEVSVFLQKAVSFCGTLERWSVFIA